MFKRNREDIYNNNSNQLKRVPSYGRLRRKMKNYDLNNFQNDNYTSNNYAYKGRNINNFKNGIKNKSNYIIEDNYPNNSHKKDIYTYYDYKNRNKNISKDNIENEENVNTNNYSNRKTKPIIRPSKSAIPNKRNCNHNNYYQESTTKGTNEILLCQNCINERLIAEKKRKKELSRESDIPEVFEDKYKNYSQNLIKEKVLQREKNIKELYNNLEKFNEISDKDKLIKENENSINPLYQNNHNYLYEKFRTNYEKKQKLIKDNFNKFQNPERPEIADYFANYVNNPKYQAIGYGEYKPKKYDINNYRKDLNDQINYRNNKIRREREEDKIRENQQYNSALLNFEKENKEKEMKKRRMKEELIRGNLELINSKKQRKEKLNEEDLRFREYYNKEDMEYQNDLLKERVRQRKINQEFASENQKNLGRIRRRKEEQLIEDGKYRYNDYSYEPPKEVTAECSACHKIYPKKLLTSNVYFYKDIRK